MKNKCYLVFPIILCFSPVAEVNAQTPTAMETASGVEINWRTESETNCQIWEIERSFFADSNYQIMAQIPGQGTTTEPHDYSWIDTTVVAVNTYYYRLAEVNIIGDRTYYGPVSVVVGFYGVEGAPVTSDRVFSLQLNQNYPNPFNKSTVISFQVPVGGPVNLSIYNITGQLVKTLINDNSVPLRIGEGREGSITWDGRDNNGRTAAKGVYIYRLTATNSNNSGGSASGGVSGDYKAAKKMVLIK